MAEVEYKNMRAQDLQWIIPMTVNITKNYTKIRVKGKTEKKNKSSFREKVLEMTTRLKQQSYTGMYGS